MIGHLLNASVTVYRASFAADGRGGRTRSTASHGTLRAKLEQPSPAERLVAARDGAVLDWIVHVLYGSDVQRGDEIDAGGARRLRVVAVVTNSRHTYTRLECAFIQGA